MLVFAVAYKLSLIVLVPHAWYLRHGNVAANVIGIGSDWLLFLGISLIWNHLLALSIWIGLSGQKCWTYDWFSLAWWFCLNSAIQDFLVSIIMKKVWNLNLGSASTFLVQISSPAGYLFRPSCVESQQLLLMGTRKQTRSLSSRLAVQDTLDDWQSRQGKA